MIALLLLSLLGPSIKFIQPKATFVLVGLRTTTIPVQIWVERHPENRFVEIRWDGESCGGSASATMDGEESAAIFPTLPLKVQIGAGECAFVAAVYGRGGKLRELARVTVEGK